MQGPDWFGCIHDSWDGGLTDDTRLSNWLQPTGSATVLNSIRPPKPQYSGLGDVLCESTYVSVVNSAPGFSVDHWIGNNVTFPNGNTSNPVLVSPGTQGNAWVQAIINTGSGLYTMYQKNFWIGAPSISQFDISNPNPPFNNLLEPGMYNQLIANDYANQSGTTYWEWDCGGWPHYDVTQTKHITNVDVPYYFTYQDIKVRLYNICGTPSQWYTERFYPYGGYLLVFSPNPATNETVLSIESTSTEKVFDETTEWELEVYSETQLLKEKKTKLKGKNTTLQTAGWQDGVYMVRVKYKEELLTGKLMVKKM